MGAFPVGRSAVNNVGSTGSNIGLGDLERQALMLPYMEQIAALQRRQLQPGQPR